MAKGYKSISANNDLAYYTNEKNIPNQDLVKETIEYFETGEGARAFKVLPLLNLLNKQYNFVVSNFSESELVISHLKNLPLTKLEKHILLGLIIKWFGGYPFNEGTNFDIKTLATKKEIEKEFLSYPEQTPEKEFCKTDNERRKYMMKLGIAFTTALNNGIDVTDVLNEMSGTGLQSKVYSNFDEMFEDAARQGALGEFESRQIYLIEKSKCNFEFNVWLQENKGFEIGNETQYRTFLTKENFIEYLKYKKERERQLNYEVELGKLSWKSLSELTTEQKIVYFQHVKYCIPFSELHNTVLSVCEFVKPVYPTIEPLKYFEYFFKEIDFLKIENNPTKAETLKYCNAIYYGLEQLLKADIDKAIFNFQSNISKQPRAQIQETQIKLIELIGNLKRQSRRNETGISFTERYNTLYKSIEAKERLFPIDYQILISHFNEAILNDLLSTYEILNDTFSESIPLLKELPTQKTETTEGKESAPEQHHPKPIKSKLEFTKDKLSEIVLQLANLNGYDNPSTYLDELLNEVKQFKDFDFECTFFLNIHYLCRENAAKFWNEGHRKDISNWLKKARIVTDVFNTTWQTLTPQQTETEQGTPKTFTEHLKDVKAAFINEEEYQQANKLIDRFFSGEQMQIDNQIFVKNGNTKNLAFALGEVWRSKKNGVITYEYLEFYKQAFSIFKSQKIDRSNLFGCNLYKYSISKT